MSTDDHDWNVSFFSGVYGEVYSMERRIYDRVVEEAMKVQSLGRDMGGFLGPTLIDASIELMVNYIVSRTLTRTLGTGLNFARLREWYAVRGKMDTSPAGRSLITAHETFEGKKYASLDMTQYGAVNAVSHQIPSPSQYHDTDEFMVWTLGQCEAGIEKWIETNVSELTMADSVEKRRTIEQQILSIFTQVRITRSRRV